MSDPLSIPIKKSAREYGYIIWSQETDDRMKELIGERETVDLVFRGADHGEKNVDWQYHRISVGYRWTQQMPESAEEYILSFDDDKDELHVSCR